VAKERIVLFDIDGTLLHAGRTPARAILRAIEEVYGVKDLMPPRGQYSFAGKTDPEIVRDLLERKGYTGEDVTEGLDEVFERYVSYLGALVSDGSDAYLHPGILVLIQRLAAMEGVLLGLLTGNIEEGARMKLALFDMGRYFVVGAYGSDSEDRSRLPAILLQKVVRLTGRRYRGDQVVIIGDSIHDIRCARTIGAKVLAVATGTTSLENLLAEGPNYAFPDLSRTESVLEVLSN
jgi:phosphoglycolate phosphatase